MSHRYGTRDHSPQYNSRPLREAQVTLSASTWATIESTTDPRAAEQPCKLQRLSDGSTRIVFPRQLGSPATHGYEVELAAIDNELATLHTTSETREEYVVMAAQWAAIQPEPELSAEAEMACFIGPMLLTSRGRALYDVQRHIDALPTRGTRHECRQTSRVSAHPGR